MFKLDCHTHTAEVSPCGRVSAKDSVRFHKEKGYDGMVVTDHYRKDYFDSLGSLSWKEKADRYLSGYRLAKAEGNILGLTVLLGMEICYAEGTPNDYLVYGFSEDFLYEFPELYLLNPEKMAAVAEQNHLFIYQAHPFRPNLTRTPEWVNGAEVFNGNFRHNSHNDQALAYTEKYQLKQIAGTDFHQEEDCAGCGILLDSPCATAEELVQRLRLENPVILPSVL